MAKELADIYASNETYELEYKGANELIDLLREKGLNIDIDGSEAEFWIETVGYFHLKGYLHCLKEPVNRQRFRYGTRFTDATEILVWERRLRSILLEQIGKVELRLRSAIVECIGGVTGAGYLLEENYDVHALRNEAAASKGRRGPVEQTSWDWFINWLERKMKEATTDNEFEFVRGHLQKRRNQQLPLWILIETFSLGDLVIVYESLSRGNRTVVANAFANPRAAGGKLRENEFAKILEALRSFRNRASHFQVFFDKRYPFPRLDEFRPKFVECDYFPNLSNARSKTCSTYEIILMLLFLEPAFQRDSTWPYEVEKILHEFPLHIEGLSEKNYGGHKGWSRTKPWVLDGPSVNEDNGWQNWQSRPWSPDFGTKRRRRR